MAGPIRQSLRFFKSSPSQFPWVARPSSEKWSLRGCEALRTISDEDPRYPRAVRIVLPAASGSFGKEKAHTKELAKAGEIGTQVHALIEFTLRMELLEKVGPSPALETKAQFAYASWQKWRQSVSFRPVMVEFTVVSKKYGYAGTADLLAEVDGVLTLVDWKTGKSVYKEAHLQNAAYRQAVREMGLGDPQQGLILRLPKAESDPTSNQFPHR